MRCKLVGFAVLPPFLALRVISLGMIEIQELLDRADLALSSFEAKAAGR